MLSSCFLISYFSKCQTQGLPTRWLVTEFRMQLMHVEKEELKRAITFSKWLIIQLWYCTKVLTKKLLAKKRMVIASWCTNQREPKARSTFSNKTASPWSFLPSYNFSGKNVFTFCEIINNIFIKFFLLAFHLVFNYIKILWLCSKIETFGISFYVVN